MSKAIRYATTINEELDLMNNTKELEPIDWFDLEEESFHADMFFKYDKPMLDKGMVRNPYYDEDFADWCDKNEESYDEPEFVPEGSVKPIYSNWFLNEIKRNVRQTLAKVA